MSHAAYERDILQRIYSDLEPLDPEGVLRHEWVNARGAIARFDRGTVEIREERGGQRGVCVFDDGSECDEWEFYRGECEPGNE